MTRTNIVLIFFLLTQTLLTPTSSQWSKRRINSHSFPRPLRTHSRSSLNGPFFFSAKPSVAASPKDDDPPAIICPDTAQSPEPTDLTDETETILQKLYKAIEDLLQKEDKDKCETEIYLEPESSEEEPSNEADSSDERVDNDFDDVNNNNETDNNPIEKIDIIEVKEWNQEERCPNSNETEENDKIDLEETITINICIV